MLSVLMANYNNGKYIEDAILSVINQTSKDWELVIVDDCSTDNSKEVIKRYLYDKRIKFYKNDTNQGYINTLKKLIEKASYAIVGILDSDDALEETAIEKVLKVYKKNKEIGFVYTQFAHCDENLFFVKKGKSKAVHSGDSNIFSCMTSAFRTFKKEAYYSTDGFNRTIKRAEDRDIIFKLEEVTSFYFINEVLYKYRQKKRSETSGFNLFEAEASHALAKYNAYKRRLSTTFPNFNKKQISEVILCDGVVYSLFSLNIKRLYFFLKTYFSFCPFNIKAWLKFPYRIAQEAKHLSYLMINRYFRSRNKIYFFFPYYHTGGAEKVHLQIVKCFKDQKSMVFFTDRSRDRRNKEEFYKYAKCFNFYGLPNKIKIIEKILAVILASIINKSEKAIVFGSNSRFFYSLIKKLKRQVRIIDLVHWLDGEIGRIIIRNTEYIHKRAVVTKAIIPVLQEAYREIGISDKQISKVRVIENFISIKESFYKDYYSKLHVIYVGRNTYEKRAKLAFTVEKELERNNNIEFTFIGRWLTSLGEAMGSKARLMDLVNSEEEMDELYKKSHIIILTSLFEGFPFAIMEAMSWGVVPITTSVGGIPLHLRNKKNSILINEENEKMIVKEIVDSILHLEKKRDLLKQYSQSAFEYARKNFLKKDFCNKYRNIMEI